MVCGGGYSDRTKSLAWQSEGEEKEREGGREKGRVRGEIGRRRYGLVPLLVGRAFPLVNPLGILDYDPHRRT